MSKLQVLERFWLKKKINLSHFWQQKNVKKKKTKTSSNCKKFNFLDL